MRPRDAGRPLGAMRDDLPPAASEFVTLLRLLFAESPLSLRHAAARAGMSAATLSRLISGKRLPDEHGLRALLRALDVEGPGRSKALASHKMAVEERDGSLRVRQYPSWAETIDSVDGGETIRIPGYAPDGSETAGLTVSREKAAELVAMLRDFLGEDVPHGV